jgi:hypothetical protein
VKTEKKPHRLATQKGTPSTCTAAGFTDAEVCLDCDSVVSGRTPLPLAPHTEEVIPATDKRTEGKKCSICDTVLIKPTWIIDSNIENISLYDGTWGYNYLETLDKARAYLEFYLRMDEACDAFHNLEASADSELVFAKLNFDDLGMTTDEALMVWCCYRNDRPLYYWMSGRIKYSTSQLWLMTSAEYASASKRAECNELVFSRVADFAELVSGADSEYDISLILHDEIILTADYAYEPDGETPDDSAPSHNILGVLTLSRGVCESYARTYQLLLNYFGVDNIFVTGYSKGVPHAWNMVKMDDGNYYLFDITWDDQPTHAFGISYAYFCVSAGEGVDWYDGGDESTSFAGKTFLENHTPDGQEMGVNFLYTLPTPAQTPFTDSDTVIRDTTFTVDGFTYAISGYKQVQLISISLSGEVVIPESVEYLGEDYAVTSIGRMKDGIFIVNFISENEITDIFVPKSVKYIFYGAFNIATLENIEVSAENEYYLDENGVLYSRSSRSEPEWIPNARL